MATSSSEIQDDQVEWLSTLRDIEDEICMIEQRIDANVKSNDECKKAYISSVETCREDVIARLDQLVEKAKHKGISIHKSNDASLKQLEQTCKETKDRIEEQKSIIRDLSQKKQPRQLYVILRKELQDMRTIVKQSFYQNRVVQFAFEVNSKVHTFLQSEIQEIGILQELCMGSDEAVEDTHSLSNVSSSKLTAPPPLPPKPVIKHVKTLQKNEVKMCELNNDDILLDTHICKIQGTCFEVYKGVLKESNRAIAVKACFETISEEQGKTLATEGKLLMQYDHKNIVKLIGIAAQRKPVMLVMEQFSDGILRDYLMENGKNMTNIQKANICLDVANGMVYLSNNRCLHMDLRAASCMVGDNQVVKIFNFAKSIEADEWDICGTYKFPIKWTSPETLQDGKYNTNSEVWSYGIIMWEVFSNGTIPYPGWTNPLALDKVKQGYRMPAPENTPNSIYQLMLRCWDAKPLTRITFQEICSALTHLMDNPQKEDHWS